MRNKSASIRLLGYLRPYRARLIVTAILMGGFALFSGITIGMISPFMKVLFTPRIAAVGPAQPGRAAVGPAQPGQAAEPAPAGIPGVP